MKTLFKWSVSLCEIILQYLSIFEVKLGTYINIKKLHQKAKGFYVPFNSQGDTGTGPQHCHLWDLNPHRGDSL